MLYFSKYIFDEMLVSSMKGKLAMSWSTDSEVTWTVFQKKIMAGIPDSDDLVSGVYSVILHCCLRAAWS